MDNQHNSASIESKMAAMSIADSQTNESSRKNEAGSNTAPNLAASNDSKFRELLNIPPKIFRDVVASNPKHRKGAEAQMRQLGMFVHDFSCYLCGFMLDEANICIYCAADSTRITQWISQQPDDFEKLEEDYISTYRKPENRSRKHQSQSVKFGFGDDPF